MEETHRYSDKENEFLKDAFTYFHYAIAQRFLK